MCGCPVQAVLVLPSACAFQVETHSPYIKNFPHYNQSMVVRVAPEGHFIVDLVTVPAAASAAVLIGCVAVTMAYQFRQYKLNYTHNMGNRTECSQPCDTLQNNLKKSPAYGDFQLVINKDREYAQVRKTIDKHTISKSELEVELQRRKNIKSPHLISLCAYSITEDPNFIDFKLQYEYIPCTLTDKIRHWRQINKSITENELSNIILGVEEALHYLYKIGIGHRCINLDTILCFNSLYKLSDISMVTFLTGYDLARQGDQNQFLSTNLLEYLHFQGTDPQYEIQDDLFSLSLVSLSLVLECQPKDFYIRKEGQLPKLNRSKIDEGLHLMSLICSGWLVNKVRMFLNDGLKQQLSTSKQSSSRKRSSFMA